MVYVFKVGVKFNDINLINSASLKFDYLFMLSSTRFIAREDINLMNRALSDKELCGKCMLFSKTT